MYRNASNYGPGVYFFPATFHPSNYMRLETIQDWYLLFEVIIKVFQAMNSNNSWRCLCRRAAQFIVTKFIICVNTSNRSTTHPVKGAWWLILTMNLQWQDIKFPDSGIHTTGKIFTDHVAFYCTKGLLYTSMILVGEGGKKKAQHYHVNTYLLL